MILGIISLGNLQARGSLLFYVCTGPYHQLLSLGGLIHKPNPSILPQARSLSGLCRFVSAVSSQEIHPVIPFVALLGWYPLTFVSSCSSKGKNTKPMSTPLSATGLLSPPQCQTPLRIQTLTGKSILIYKSCLQFPLQMYWRSINMKIHCVFLHPSCDI